MKRTWLAALLLCACGGSTLPDPTLDGIAPAASAASDATEVTVQVHGVLPTTVDYDDASVKLDPTVAIQIGNEKVGTATWKPDGSLSCTVPSIFAPGVYDVHVAFTDGREAVLPNGFTVTAGKWPSYYSVDGVADQRAGVPFSITVQAHGQNGPAFHGNVYLRSNKGEVTPALSSPFEAGTLTQSVTLAEPQKNVILIVRDVAGNIGFSNAFDVNP
jgi:hypothetical protein